jgi:hypothetical protein
MVCDVADEAKVRGAWATLPIYGVTVYEVMEAPPSYGADHDTDASPFPAMALTPVGAAGTVGGAPGMVVATVALVVVVDLSDPPLPDPFGWGTVRSVDPEAPPVFVDPEGGMVPPADGPPAPFVVVSPSEATFPEPVESSL